MLLDAGIKNSAWKDFVEQADILINEAKEVASQLRGHALELRGDTDHIRLVQFRHLKRCVNNRASDIRLMARSALQYCRDKVKYLMLQAMSQVADCMGASFKAL